MTILLLVSLLALIALSVPIAFSIGLSSLLVLLLEVRLTPLVLVQRLFSGLDSFVIIAIPLFLLTAEIMNSAGITKKLIDLSYALVGHIKGGLALINVVVSMVFAGISGSSTADTAGIGAILIPAMKKKGYSTSFSVSITAASSTMGQIIPPSIIAVIYASTTGISIGALFMAGFLPGLLIGGSQMALTIFMAKKYGFPREEKLPWRQRMRAVASSILPMITPIIIIGGIIGGLFTPTEAAVIAASYSLVLAVFIYRSITMKQLWKIMIKTGLNSSVTLICIGIASIFGYLLSYYRVPAQLGGFIRSIGTNPSIFMIMVVGIFLVVGTFMDATPSIIMLAPIVAPIANSLGIHPVHLGIVVVSTMALGLVTPPYGLCLLVATQIGETSMTKVYKTTLVFILMILIIVLIIALLPDLALFFPRVLTPRMM